MEIWKEGEISPDSLDPASVFTKDGLLKCPHCGEYYTHLENIVPYEEGDLRPCVELVFSCEHCAGEDKLFSLCIHQHEGFTFLTGKPIK